MWRRWRTGRNVDRHVCRIGCPIRVANRIGKAVSTDKSLLRRINHLPIDYGHSAVCARLHTEKIDRITIRIVVVRQHRDRHRVALGGVHDIVDCHGGGIFVDPIDGDCDGRRRAINTVNGKDFRQSLPTVERLHGGIAVVQVIHPAAIGIDRERAVVAMDVALRHEMLVLGTIRIGD